MNNKNDINNNMLSKQHLGAFSKFEDVIKFYKKIRYCDWIHRGNRNRIGNNKRKLLLAGHCRTADINNAESIKNADEKLADKINNNYKIEKDSIDNKDNNNSLYGRLIHVLCNMQHDWCQSPFIDLTKDFLVAVFFSCFDRNLLNHKIDREDDDYRQILSSITKHDDYSFNSYEKLRNIKTPEEFFEKIREGKLFNDRVLIDHRIYPRDHVISKNHLTQNSVLLCANIEQLKEMSFFEILIPKDMYEDFLKKLDEKYNISAYTILLEQRSVLFNVENFPFKDSGTMSAIKSEIDKNFKIIQKFSQNKQNNPNQITDLLKSPYSNDDFDYSKMRDKIKYLKQSINNVLSMSNLNDSGLNDLFSSLCRLSTLSYCVADWNDVLLYSGMAHKMVEGKIIDINNNNSFEKIKTYAYASVLSYLGEIEYRIKDYENSFNYFNASTDYIKQIPDNKFFQSKPILIGNSMSALKLLTIEINQKRNKKILENNQEIIEKIIENMVSSFGGVDDWMKNSTDSFKDASILLGENNEEKIIERIEEIISNFDKVNSK